MLLINKYPDGTSYVNNTLLGEQVFRINSYEDLWHLNQFVDAFHSQYSTLTARILPNIIIPNLLDAQADRRFNKGESSGLKLVLEFLNRLEANFKIFHPHNPEVVEGLLNRVEIIDNSEFIEKILDKLRPINNLILLSTDGGSYKWINKIADKIGFRNEVYGASKMRKYENKESKLIQVIDRQNFEGKDILIIDDICVYGGTFVGLAKILKERGCGKLYLAVSHLTVNRPNPELFSLFDEVFTTNSKGLDYEVPTKNFFMKPNNLKIIDLF